MQLNVAGFIDSGFVRASVADALGIETGKVRLDAPAIVELIEQAAGRWSGLLLRAYWYEGQYAVTDPLHDKQRKYLKAVGATTGVHLRVGHLVARTPTWHRRLDQALDHCGVDRQAFARVFDMQPEYQQKGVDTLMVLDLVRLAQRGAYDVAVIFSGDRDIAEAVRAAQDEGRRVILLVPADREVAQDLIDLADSVTLLSAEQVRSLHRRPAPGQERQAAGTRTSTPTGQTPPSRNAVPPDPTVIEHLTSAADAEDDAPVPQPAAEPAAPTVPLPVVSPFAAVAAPGPAPTAEVSYAPSPPSTALGDTPPAAFVQPVSVPAAVPVAVPAGVPVAAPATEFVTPRSVEPVLEPTPPAMTPPGTAPTPTAAPVGDTSSAWGDLFDDESDDSATQPSATALAQSAPAPTPQPGPGPAATSFEGLFAEDPAGPAPAPGPATLNPWGELPTAGTTLGTPLQP